MEQTHQALGNPANMRDPFDLSDAVIRDLPHVRVTRHAPRNQRPCEYRKVFKPEGLRDADYWIQRENDFLLDFRVKKLRHTVELAAYAQHSDGRNTPVAEAVATYDAGLTLEDWLRIKPRYANEESRGHPFQQAGVFLSLLRACLVALKEIHGYGIVHCDIKEDNLCLPYTPYPFKPGQAVRLEFGRLRLIDFAFSITPERPLQRRLPIVAKAEYQSQRLKAALDKDLSAGTEGTIHAQQLDYRVDLYSLGHMAERILHEGLQQPRGPAGFAALAGANQLVERLKNFGSGEETAGAALPHDSLIAEIDAWLKPLADKEVYQKFSVDTFQDIPIATPTPLAAPSAANPDEGQDVPQKQNRQEDEQKAAGSKSKQHATMGASSNPSNRHKGLVLIAEALGGLAVIVPVLYYGLMLPGYLDWTHICTLPDEDQQIRDCRLWTVPSHYPTPSVEPPKLSLANAETSKDKSLSIGIDADKYRIGDSLQLQISVAKPLFVNVLQWNSSGHYDLVFPDKKSANNSKPIDPGTIADGKVSLKGPAGKEQLIAIALEQPIPNDIVPIDENGKLTKAELEQAPIVVRLDYKLTPGPPNLDCFRQPSESFKNSVDDLWPRKIAAESDAVRVWEDTLHKLAGILEQTKPSEASRDAKVIALSCLATMGNNKDGRARKLLNDFKSKYDDYRIVDAFADWLIALENHPHSPPPKGYAVWWENGYALKKIGDKTATEDQADLPPPAEKPD